MGERGRRLAAMAVMAAALALRPDAVEVACGQTAPAQAADGAAAVGAVPAGAAAAIAPATAIADPATILRATTSTQVERDEAARRLVQRRTPQARDALLAAMQDVANRAAQIAAARALAGDVNVDPAFVPPLFALVGGGAEVTDPAIAALANFRNDRNISARLLDFASDARQPIATRRSAIKAAARMSDKAAARTLVTIATSGNEPPELQAAAISALSEMTGLPPQEPAQWQQWWSANAGKPDAAFERELLGARASRLTILEERFNRMVAETRDMLSESYRATPGKNREAVLLRYLGSLEPEVRLVGVNLLQEDFIQSRLPSPAASARLHRMVGDSSPRVRLAVAEALKLLNDPAALPAILEQLAQEPSAEVRAELAKALAPTRDLQVVEPLLALLRDSSPAVAQVAADALRELGAIIQKDAELARRVAQALREALEARSGSTGDGRLRAALIDAMGALKNPELRVVYTRLLRPSEPVPVRRAALRALGSLEQPWAAEIIVNALDDPDDNIRLEAINALDTTANFTQAEKLYSVLKSSQEKPAIRQRAWAVLRNRFPDPSATNDALGRWADRFKDEPERRIEILEVLAARLVASRDLASLATVQQNIGEAKMKLAETSAAENDHERVRARAQEADKYFELALAYYRSKNPRDQDMVTSALIEQRMDALLASRQYSKAVDFAASSIGIHPGNQEPMGRKLRNEADRLRGTRQYNEAIALIEAVNQMNPRLAEPFFSSIKNIEADVRQRLSGGQGDAAVGSGQ